MLEALDEVGVQPRVISRHNEQVPHYRQPSGKRLIDTFSAATA
jgi:hypothetical protein